MTIHWLRPLPILNCEHELVGIVSLTNLLHALADVCLDQPHVVRVKAVADRATGRSQKH
jgi:CBS-domain-containing membrane protein